MIDVTLYSLRTRCIILGSEMRVSQEALADVQCEADPDLGWVRGHFKDPQSLYVTADGQVVPRTPEALADGLFTQPNGD